MKSLIYKGKEELEFKDTKPPIIEKENEVVIDVKYAGICGSDITIWKGKHLRAKTGTILGHEFVGTVNKTSPNIKNLKNGDKVVVEPLFHCETCDFCKEGQYNLCNQIGLYGVDEDGGFAEQIKVPINKVFKVETDLEKMALVEPIAVAVNAVNNSAIELNSTVLIFGAGTIGLLIADIAQILGAGEVVICEIDESRLEIARSLGYKVFNPKNNLESNIENKKFDLIFDAAGSPKIIELGLKFIKKSGQFNIVAIHKQNAKIDLQKIVYSEINIQGRFIYTHKDFKKAIQLIENGKINPENYITKILSFKDIQEGFKLMERGKNNLKILVRVN